jgi:glucosamine--fructose-6-phosphate aminotransferase (isomerizing)
LAGLGANFVTETDTETVALLTQHYMSQGLSPVDAATKTLTRLQGAFALAFLFDGEEDLMIGARKGAPLAVGHGDNEMFLGSDAIALSPMTNRITYLEEGDRVILTRNSVDIFDANGSRANRAIKTISLDSTRVDKAGHKHFMAKEIAEQPSVIAEALSHYVSADNLISLPDPGLDFTSFDRITMVACGTAYYACLTAKYWFEQIARLPVEVDFASEFRYREPPIPGRTLAMFVSQSGETADTLAALRYCDGKADKIASVVNVTESSIARESDLALPIHAGVEVGVASTKAFTCQLTVLFLLTLKAAVDRGTITQDQLADHMSALRSIPSLINTALEQNATIRDAAQKLSSARDVLFLGRGAMFPLALEGALKLKEISYIHAEAYASGELKHGPIALVDENVPVVVMAPKDTLFDKTVSNMQEVMARKGKVILISDRSGLDEAAEGTWAQIEMPPVADALAPILYAIPAQLLAYHTAIAKGTDADQPRNLAKSVTVE